MSGILFLRHTESTEKALDSDLARRDPKAAIATYKKEHAQN